MSERVLIAGCGDLGTELGLRLAARGWEVFGGRRSPEVLPAPIIGVRSDLEGDLGALPPDLDVVVHAAAAGGRGVTGYEAVYRDGLGRLLQRLDDDGQAPRRVVFVSATSVYGVDDGSEVDEDTPTEPSRATGRVLVEAEQLLAASALPGTSVRLAGVYGPGRTRLIDTVRDGTARQPVGDHPTNRIHRDDAAAAIVHLLTEVDDPDEVYVGVDHDQAQLADVQRFLAAELGVPEPPPADEGDTTGRRSGAKRCCGDRLRDTGFTFRYPTYREGYQAILAGEGTRHP
ncbi:SDR family oxidoreductase [Nitriliruptor alkaliphilus]|uniref:SDR family oxidoreductase n=1 Tax=Nitriliruptor alkaliphilus TaxID=427918 RepID=UPI000695B0E0|nr:SDR family oxidoreductase [Nitriliruptor alkaliphilus]